MIIRHYLYNAFLVEEDGKKIAIDPGQNLWLFNLKSLIPKSEWSSITHILITHGDPDHHWQSDRVAKASGAYVICGRELTKKVAGEDLVIDPRGKALTSWVRFDNLHPLEVGEKINLEEVEIEAVKTVHGPIVIPFLWFKSISHPGPEERIGLGSMGYKITLNNKSIVNLGDSLLQKEWENLKPDVLMLPIGGFGNNIWTMDMPEAVEAVKIISPKHVIPCHYSVPFIFRKKYATADANSFKLAIEKMGIRCSIMKYGDTVTI